MKAIKPIYKTQKNPAGANTVRASDLVPVIV